ncbi:MAG: hypothetical protein Q8O89_03310 [Nanoarchaeota archaeon]|nr:hypothetical protein [Nanoarchaeota archaeon]
MKKSVSKKLKLWAINNNWVSSSPSDDDRFEEFVIEAFNNEDYDITEDDFYSQLISYCSDEDILTDSYIKYKNSIEILKRFAK